ncbi:MAG: alkaline phosphatase family protein [Candidatus Methylumidiphilus sp.]
MNYKLACTLAFTALFSVGAANAKPGAAPPKGLDKIGHIIVIYLENHSFDNLYGLFPGADGIAQAKPGNTLQVDANGKAYTHLPSVMDTRRQPPVLDTRFPQDLPNKPFLIDQYVPDDQKIGDLVHRFHQHQMQINDGAMNRFAEVSDAGGLVMGYYDGRKLPLWQYAKRYTLADHFFQAAFGGSFINHLWLACACTPRYDNAPEELRALVNDQGEPVKDPPVTQDGFAVNTLFPSQGPLPGGAGKKRLPPLIEPTLGDRLSGKGVDWAWYAGGWNDAVAGHPDPLFQFHHQPYVYFKRYSAESEERAKHLKDLADLLAGIDKGELPPVVFYKPIGALNEHPNYADVLSGDRHIADLLGKLERSALWKDSVVIVTYDENGGFWDHAPPPKGDRWGPGSRVPTLIVSPFARHGQVDATVYDTTSILKLIENRFGLEPLGERDAKANSLAKALKL